MIKKDQGSMQGINTETYLKKKKKESMEKTDIICLKKETKTKKISKKLS